MSSDLAQRIRDARAARGISIEDAERDTKIRAKYLEAIEAGDFAELPDGLPARGFVKNYARYLGLNPEEALSEFEAEVGVPVYQLKEPVPPPPTRQKPISKLTQVALPDVRWKGALPGEADADLNALAESEDAAEASTQAVAKREATTGQAVVLKPSRGLRATGSSFRLKRKRQPYDDYDPHMMTARGRSMAYRYRPKFDSSGLSRYFPAVLATMAALVVLVVGGTVFLPALGNMISSVRTPSIQTPAQTQAGAPSSDVTNQPVPEVTIFAPLPARAPETAQSGQAASQPPAQPLVTTPAPAISVQPNPGGGLQLALDAREHAWVRVKVDDNVIFEGILPIGPSAPWSAKDNVTIETGNAGAFDVILNGTRIGPAGARNETIRKKWGASGQVQ
jgi:transcriptional regulator with XRE-family HTH domain